MANYSPGQRFALALGAPFAPDIDLPRFGIGEAAHVVSWVRERLGQTDERGWALAQAAALVRSALHTDMIDAAAAWQLLLEIAARAQATFGSWDAFAASYERGARGAGDARALADARDVWQRVPWTTDLADIVSAS